MKRVYLDYAAATPVDERVLKLMLPFFSKQFYNPSSSYLAAKEVKERLQAARGQVAHWLGIKPSEVVFTAGATESINMAISGVMTRHPNARVLVSAIEHEAVLAAARQFSHALLPVLPSGILDVGALQKSITDDTVLVSVGYANNEIGTVQPLSEIAEVIKKVRELRRLKNNPLPLYLHTDASQAGCYLNLQMSRMGVDLLTLNGGKMYGPKQTGVLAVRAGVQFSPLLVGGGQENGLRSGTENVPGVIGLAAALDIAQTERKEAGVKVGKLRDELQTRLLEAFPNLVINGHYKKRLPHILHFSLPGVDGERLLMTLDEAGVMASTGSACAANKQTASHVLAALGQDTATIQGSLRLSLGRFTTPQEVDFAAGHITRALKAAAK